MDGSADDAASDRWHASPGSGHECCGSDSFVASGWAVDRRRFELQIEAVLVVYRAQRRTGPADSLADTRRRGLAILDSLLPETDGDPEREERLAAARQELDAPIGDS